jgi:ATP adenylyltransferase
MERKFFTNEMFDTILLESKHFNVVPSLGSLVEGWVLITPKEESLNFSMLSEERYSELENLISEIRNIQISLYGSSLIFEHGPMRSCSNTGCGVDYAHLHMVPISFDLLSGIQKFLNIDLKFQEIRSISEIVDLNKDNLDYLYYRTPDNHQFCAFKPEFPSQIFRQVIAYYLGIPEKYRWREYPESKMIEKTISDFEAIKVCHEQ